MVLAPGAQNDPHVGNSFWEGNLKSRIAGQSAQWVNQGPAPVGNVPCWYFRKAKLPSTGEQYTAMLEVFFTTQFEAQRNRFTPRFPITGSPCNLILIETKMGERSVIALLLTSPCTDSFIARCTSRVRTILTKRFHPGSSSVTICPCPCPQSPRRQRTPTQEEVIPCLP